MGIWLIRGDPVLRTGTPARGFRGYLNWYFFDVVPLMMILLVAIPELGVFYR